MSAAEIANIYSSINNIQLGLNEVTGNSFSNYNQLSRIVAQQANIYNSVYYGSGNIVTGNLYVSSNALITGNLVISNGNVGIWTSNPLANLDVQGNARINGNVNIGNGNLFMNRFGNLGLGTTSPLATLDISGNARITGNVNIDNGLVWTDNINNRVGILNTNPQYTLDIAGSANIAGNLILPTSLIQTYTPIVTPGTNLALNAVSIPVSRYFTLGSLKVAFGVVPMKWTNTSTVSGATFVGLPSSFFTNVFTFNITVSNVGVTAQQRVIGAGFNTSGLNFYSESVTGSASNTFDVSFLIIGN